MILLRDAAKFPLQLILRDMLVMDSNLDIKNAGTDCRMCRRTCEGRKHCCVYGSCFDDHLSSSGTSQGCLNFTRAKPALWKTEGRRAVTISGGSFTQKI
jgi:hypothetical protein